MQSMQVHCATHNEHCMHLGLGMLYSVDLRTRGIGDPGTRDPGPRDLRPMDPNWCILYMYIHSTCVSNCSTGMHYGMDYEILRPLYCRKGVTNSGL